MKVSLACQKAGFNHAQHHLPLKQMGAVCLRGAPIPTAVRGLVRSQCCAEGDGAHHSQGSDHRAGHNRWGSDQFTCQGLALDCTRNDLLKL